ncbi:MAG: hypothetical protein GX270_09210 [Clostridiaceae bacterium]|jgi:hypothetical protein|nr:hypothetical protein [Clostridiaceae bacterium]
MSKWNVNISNKVEEEGFSIKIEPHITISYIPSSEIRKLPTLDELGYSFEIGV